MNRTLRITICSVFISCLGIAIGFAAKPVDIPVTVSFRSGPDAALDGVRGDGAAHAATIINGGGSLSYGWSNGQVWYDLRVDNVYSADPINCPPGQITGIINGGGTLRVTLDAGTFLAMPLMTPQTGFATYNISSSSPNYLLRFRAVDDLNVQPPANCSTQVTITRTAGGVSPSGASTGTWIVEADSSDIARLVTNAAKGPGFTNQGHYQPTFKLTVQK
jgi:hypothetical protein